MKEDHQMKKETGASGVALGDSYRVFCDAVADLCRPGLPVPRAIDVAQWCLNSSHASRGAKATLKADKMTMELPDGSTIIVHFRFHDLHAPGIVAKPPSGVIPFASLRLRP